MKSIIVLSIGLLLAGASAQAAPGSAAAPTAPSIAQPPPSGHTEPQAAQPPMSGHNEPLGTKPVTGTKPADSGPSCTQNIAPGQPPGCPPAPVEPTPGGPGGTPR